MPDLQRSYYLRLWKRRLQFLQTILMLLLNQSIDLDLECVSIQILYRTCSYVSLVV